MSRRETVQLNHVLTQDVKMLYGFTVCCASDQKVLLRGAYAHSPAACIIKLFDISTEMQIAEWPSPCSHEFCPVREIRFPSDRQTLYYVESCNRCPRITLYDASTKEAVLGTEERKWMPARMTTTPTGHVILSDIGGDRLVGLRWDPNDRQLAQTDWNLSLDVGVVTGLAFLNTHNLIVVVALDKKLVRAYHHPSKRLQWEVKGAVAGIPIRPRGVCCDRARGLVFVSDFYNQRVLVLDGASGSLRQVVLAERSGVVYDVSWNDSQPHLLVKHGQHNKYQISLFSVHYKS